MSEIGSGSGSQDLDPASSTPALTGQRLEQPQQRLVEPGQVEGNLGVGLYGFAKFRWRTVGNDLSLRHHRYPISQVLGFVEIMRGQHDRVAERSQIGDDIPTATARTRIEPCGGLVKKDQFGVADQTKSQVHPATLTARKRNNPIVGLVCQLHKFDQFIDRSRVRVRRTVKLKCLTSRQFAVNPSSLQHDPDAVPKTGSTSIRISSQNRHIAAVTAAVTFENLNGGCLARTVGAQDRQDLALSDIKADAIDCTQIPIRLGELADSDRRGHLR